MSSKSVFELILSGEIESEIIYEDDDIFAINDINPVARVHILVCLLYTSPSPRDRTRSRMPSSA